MSAPSDQRALARALGALDDAELAALLSQRQCSPTATWRDAFDAADALLDPVSISRGLTRVPAPLARALSAAGSTPVAAEAAPALVRRALVDLDGRPFRAVAAAVSERPVPDAVEDARPAAATPAAAAVAAERAFTATASLADILLRTLDAPLVRIGNGALGAGDRRALVDAGDVADSDTADALIAIASITGLMAAAERAWLATADAREWISRSTAQRWTSVAESLRDALPEGLRTDEGGWIAASGWPHAYPFDAAWPERAAHWRTRFTVWGLLTDDGAEPAWAAALARGAEVDAAALAAVLPAEVDRVFLQNDLTAIAPGPLIPALDVRLRRIARRESRAQASSYRFDAETVSAAITAGETAQSLREFLTALSLTGLPQPLEYVIERTAAQHGSIRVGADPATGRARVRASDPSLLDPIAVDQALRPLGLVRDGADLVSRLSDDAVFWALADARYPVISVDAHDAPRTLDRARLGVAAETTPAQTYAELIRVVRTGDADDDTDAAWLERELDRAVRARAVIDVVVELPDGTTRTFRLEATGLGGGRLRGRDRGADVERTVPLSRIRGAHPVDD